jgi:hypothetical protein
MKNIDVISKVLEILPTINQKYPNINFVDVEPFPII